MRDIRIFIGCVILCLAVVSGTAAVQSDEEPIGEQELYDLLTVQKVPAAELVEMIKRRGLSFPITPTVEENLTERAKANPIILETIRMPATLTFQLGAGGITVTVGGEERGQSGDDGAFTLDGLPGGTHVVRFTSPDHIGKTEEYFVRPAEVREERVRLLGAIQGAVGPYGTQVSLAAGTGADAAFREVQSLPDPTAKIARLKEVIAQYDSTPAALLGYEQLIALTLDIRDYDAADAASAELQKRDPRNFRAVAGHIRAALGRADVPGATDHAARLAEILSTAKTMAVPEGLDESEWELGRQAFARRGEAEVQAIQYELFTAAFRQPPAVKTQVLARFVEYFPESIYRKSAMSSVAIAYQEQGNAAKATEWAEKTLAIDPDNINMLMVAGDVLSNTGESPEKAGQMLQHLLELMTDPVESERVRPAGYSDEQWAGQKMLYEGVARSGIGQIARVRGNVQSAIGHFEAAAPLLKQQPFYYARNQYRWASMLASIGQQANLEKAARLLGEIIPMNTPFSPFAQGLLDQINAKLGR